MSDDYYDRWRAKKMDAGFCTNCGKTPPRPGRLYCKPCGAKRAADARASYYRRHPEAKPRAVCCGICGKPGHYRQTCEGAA